MLDIGHVHARAHDVAETRSRLLECATDVPERLDRLGVRIPRSHDLAARIGRRRAGNVDDASHPDRARIADDWLPRRAARDGLPGHRPSKPGTGGGAAFQVTCEGAPVDRASRIRSSVARTFLTTACPGLTNLTPPTALFG